MGGVLCHKYLPKFKWCQETDDEIHGSEENYEGHLDSLKQAISETSSETYIALGVPAQKAIEQDFEVMNGQIRIQDELVSS